MHPAMLALVLHTHKPKPRLNSHMQKGLLHLRGIPSIDSSMASKPRGHISLHHPCKRRRCHVTWEGRKGGGHGREGRRAGREFGKEEKQEGREQATCTSSED